MLNMKGRGEMLLLKPSKDVRGDNVVKTVRMKFSFIAVPLQVVVDGFVGQLSLFYSKDDDLKIDDLEYLPVSRHIANVTADVGGVVIERSIVDHVRITPRAGRIVDVQLVLKGEIVEGLDQLHDLLKTTVEVGLIEHEFEAEEEGSEDRLVA